jgi:ABC-type transporter Mla subunit MlaD
MSSGKAKVIRTRLQGLAFLVVLALLLGLSVAAYNKAFTTVARVTLETDTAGNQLQEASDVKVRGVLVGEVREVRASAEGATIELAINPAYLDEIPADVSARLLPKTLFGERFVALELPEQPGRERLADGDVIGQDRSENAIELQRVVDDMLPLLQAVEPQNLSYTLGAVADALRGRGDDLGANLASTGRYVGEINTVLPELQKDISTPTTPPPTTCWPFWTTSPSRTPPSSTRPSSCAGRSRSGRAPPASPQASWRATSATSSPWRRPPARCSASSRSTHRAIPACSKA